MDRPSVLFAIPDGPLKAHMFTEDWRERLERLYQVTWNRDQREWTSDELAAHIDGKTALITGWGSAKICASALDRADRLRVIAHCAGTVRPLVDEDFFARGIVLTNANLALAPSVAEYCLMAALMARWNILQALDLVADGGWQGNNAVVPGLNGARIGLIGYGAIAQALLHLLRPFDVEVLLCSAHFDPRGAPGVRMASFEEAMGCDIVSIHKTLTPATWGMIDARALSLMPDGGVLINTARGPVVDEAALIREAASGRIGAVVDVFDQEPPPAAHPLRHMPGVIATPHCAGTSLYWRQQMAELVLADIGRALNGRTPLGLITADRYRRLTPA